MESLERNTFLVLSRNVRRHIRVTLACGAGYGKPGRYEYGINENKCHLSGKFSTESKKMADFKRHLRECLERQNHKRQTEQWKHD